MADTLRDRVKTTGKMDKNEFVNFYFKEFSTHLDRSVEPHVVYKQPRIRGYLDFPLILEDENVTLTVGECTMRDLHDLNVVRHVDHSTMGQSDDRAYTEIVADPASQLATLSAAAYACLLYTSPSPRDQRGSRMPSSA